MRRRVTQRTPTTAIARAGIAWATATILALFPGQSGFAAASKIAREAPAKADIDLGALWREAQAHMGTSNYGEAIAVLTRLYQEVAPDPEAKALRMRVQWALHQAHMGAYAVDKDPQHLYVAADLIEKYRAETPEDDTTVSSKIDAAASLVGAAIERHEESQRQSQPEPAPPPPPIATPSAAPKPAPPTPQPTPPQPDPERYRPYIISGGVLLAAGVAGVGMTIGGFSAANSAVGIFENEPRNRDDARSDVERNNTIGIVGAVLAGVFIISGATLLALGLVNRRKDRKVAAARGSLQFRF